MGEGGGRCALSCSCVGFYHERHESLFSSSRFLSFLRLHWVGGGAIIVGCSTRSMASAALSSGYDTAARMVAVQSIVSRFIAYSGYHVLLLLFRPPRGGATSTPSPTGAPESPTQGAVGVAESTSPPSPGMSRSPPRLPSVAPVPWLRGSAVVSHAASAHELGPWRLVADLAASALTSTALVALRRVVSAASASLLDSGEFGGSAATALLRLRGIAAIHAVDGLLAWLPTALCQKGVATVASLTSAARLPTPDGHAKLSAASLSDRFSSVPPTALLAHMLARWTSLDLLLAAAGKAAERFAFVLSDAVMRSAVTRTSFRTLTGCAIEASLAAVEEVSVQCIALRTSTLLNRIMMHVTGTAFLHAIVRLDSAGPSTAVPNVLHRSRVITVLVPLVHLASLLFTRVCVRLCFRKLLRSTSMDARLAALSYHRPPLVTHDGTTSLPGGTSSSFARDSGVSPPLDFDKLSSWDLAAVSRVANETLVCGQDNQATRLGMVRLLSLLQRYVKQVNERRIVRTFDRHSVFCERHRFTSAQIDAASAAGHPYTCVICGLPFVIPAPPSSTGVEHPHTDALILYCGHQVHAGTDPSVLCSPAGLAGDWCPACSVPCTAAPTPAGHAIAARRALHTCQSYVHIYDEALPRHLWHADWSTVAQEVRCRGLVGPEVKLAAVSGAVVPGSGSWPEALLDSFLTLLGLCPANGEGESLLPISVVE